MISAILVGGAPGKLRAYAANRFRRVDRSSDSPSKVGGQTPALGFGADRLETTD
jgi:hypothetical protein